MEGDKEDEDSEQTGWQWRNEIWANLKEFGDSQTGIGEGREKYIQKQIIAIYLTIQKKIKITLHAW